MRPGTLLSALLVAAPALAQDARIVFLSKQLQTATDPRTRAQTALILAKTNNIGAVAPLCSALKDPESVVRSAAAGGLGELRFPEAAECLKSALGESDPAVRAALARALEAPAAVKPAGLIIAVEPVNDKVGSLSPEVLNLAETLIRDKVASMGATLVVPLDPKAAANVRNIAKGWQLRPNLLPNGEKGLKLEILILSYPDLALQGQVKVGAQGGKYEAQLKALVPKALSDAAGEYEWQQ